MGCRYHPESGTHADPLAKKKRLCDQPVCVRLICRCSKEVTDFYPNHIPNTVPWDATCAIQAAVKARNAQDAKKIMKGKQCQCPRCNKWRIRWVIVTCNQIAS